VPPFYASVELIEHCHPGSCGVSVDPTVRFLPGIRDETGAAGELPGSRTRGSIYKTAERIRK
jgi:hypothetical protein